MDGDYSKFLAISKFSPELSEFLHEAKPYSYFDICCRFVQYLCNFVFKVHENDHDTDSVLNSYNPEYGCAYYFTEHGNKLQLLPVIKMIVNRRRTADRLSSDPTFSSKIKILSRCSFHL